MQLSGRSIARLFRTKPLDSVVAEFNLSVPIIVAPMAPSKGGPSTPSFVAASCNSGALGILGSAYSSPAQMISDVATIKRLTSRPFGINLFSPMPTLNIQNSELESATRALESFRRELNLPLYPSLEPPFHPNFDEQFEVVLASKPALFTWVFGPLPHFYLQECTRHGIKTSASCTTVEEGRELESLGIDFLVGQGFEAGGHRAIFDPYSQDPNISTMGLLIGLKRAGVKVPIVASGGIMRGTDIKTLLSSGASAVQMGTAFLLCSEAGTSAPYRRILKQSPSPRTTLTRAFSGRLARGLENKFILEIDGKSRGILSFPAQNAFTRDIRSASNAKDSFDYLSLWAGMGVSSIRGGFSVGELIQILKVEIEQ